MCPDGPCLAPRQRALLLAVAREAICARLGAGAVRTLPSPDPLLCAPAAAFVTLRKGRALRGCIGHVEAVKPLVEAVAHCAACAATADPRFPPVRVEDLPHLSLEISVLSPLSPVEHPEEIDPGRHGVLVRQDARQGLLLPQVATEFGWDRDTFLRQVCAKAGLPQDAWQRGARLWRFTVEHFSDELPVAPA
jgi:AmmeMemoRadiSam system protein A